MWFFWLVVGVIFVTLSSAFAMLAFMAVFAVLLAIVALWLVSLLIQGIRYIVIRYSA